MVPRLLIGAALLVVMLAAAGPAAEARNTRVSIANYAWSSSSVQIDLNEKVTWDWLGPDLVHSVTGVSPNALGLDSDPLRDAPSHRPGDSFTLQFGAPGTFAFQCKLHSAVAGEVIVSSVPGDPSSDPGPRAPLNLDVKRPTLGEVRLRRSRSSRRHGIPTTLAVSERGRIEADYYRLGSAGKRVFNGYGVWKAFIGINRIALGARWAHFKARPGRYLAVLRATDLAANVSKPVSKRFSIAERGARSPR